MSHIDLEQTTVRANSGVPSISDVASAAGVSVSTVSKVLNHRPDVSLDTRRRVLEAIERLGYRPRQAAVHYDQVGYVYIGGTARLGSLFDKAVVEGLLAACGSGLTLCIRAMDRRAFLSQSVESLMRKSNFRGLLLPVASDPQVIDHLLESPRRVVLVGAYKGTSAVNTVTVDNKGAASEAARYLLGLGHRRIAAVGMFSTDPASAERLEAFRTELAKYDVPLEENDVIDASAISPQGVAALLRRVVDRQARPTALFVTDYRLTLAAYSFLLSYGLRLPADISLLGWGDYDYAQLVNPPLSVVAVPSAEIGRVAIETLLLLEQEAHAPPLIRELPASIVSRGTTSYPPGP